MKKLILVLVLSGIFNLAYSQTAFRKELTAAHPKVICQNPDGSYLAGFDSTNGFALMKLTKCGDQEFYRFYPTASHVELSAVSSDLSNGNMVSFTNFSGTPEARTMRINHSGDSLYSFTVAVSPSYSGNATSTPDGNFIWEVYHPQAGGDKRLLIKSDMPGIPFWTSTLPGTALPSTPSTESTMEAQSDGSTYWFVNSTYLSGSQELQQYHLFHLALMGDTLASVNIRGTGNFSAKSICSTYSDGLLVGGSFNGISGIQQFDYQLNSVTIRDLGFIPQSIITDNNGGYFVFDAAFKLYHLDATLALIKTIDFAQLQTIESIQVKPTLDQGFLFIGKITGGSSFSGSVLIKANANCSADPDTITRNAIFCNGSQFELPGGQKVTSPGTYTSTIHNAFGCDSIIVTNLSVDPAIQINVSADPVSCYGEQTTVIVTATGGTGPYIGTGNFQISASNTAFFVIDSVGCSAMQALSITQPDPIAINAGTDQTICEGENIMLGSTPTASGGTGPFTYQWYINGQSVFGNQSNPTLSVTSSNTYLLMVIDANGCANSDEVTILMNQPTPPVIQQSNDTLFVAEAGIEYDWYLNGVLISTTTNPFIVSTQNGIYSCMLHDIFGCTSISAEYAMTTTQIAQVEKSGVFAYPIPASSYLNIEFDSATLAKSGSICRIANAHGSIVHSFPVKERLTRINISDWTAKGLYLLQVTDAEGITTKTLKIIIQ